MQQINNRIQDRNGRVHQSRAVPAATNNVVPVVAALEILHCDIEVPDAAAIIQTHFGDITRLSVPMINPISGRRSNAGKKPSGHLDTRLIKIVRPSLSSIHGSQNSTVEPPRQCAHWAMTLCSCRSRR